MTAYFQKKENEMNWGWFGVYFIIKNPQIFNICVFFLGNSQLCPTLFLKWSEIPENKFRYWSEIPENKFRYWSEMPHFQK